MSADAEFFRKERENIENALGMIEDLLGRPALSQYEVIALGTLLQNVYTGIESILRWQLTNRGTQVRRTESWHKELLTRSRQVGLVSEPHVEWLTELLLYRHMHIHGYGHMLDEVRLRELAAPVPQLCREYLQRAAEQSE